MALYFQIYMQPKSLLNTKRDEYNQKKLELEELKTKLALLDKTIAECNKHRESRKERKLKHKEAEKKEKTKRQHS